MDFEASFAATSLAHPSQFARDVEGWTPWWKQDEVMDSVFRNRRTLVKSGHGTGKSRLLASITNWFVPRHPGSKTVISASTNEQIYAVVWPEIGKLRAQASKVLDLGGNFGEREWKIDREGWHAKPVSVDNPAALQGRHAPFGLIIIDEAEGFPVKNWEAVDSLLSSGDWRIIICYNPVSSSGYCYEQSQLTELWNVITISCLDHPNIVNNDPLIIPGAVTPEWIEEKRKYEGEDSAFWQARVLGEHPVDSQDCAVSRASLVEGAKGTVGVDQPPRIACDVAWQGSDKTVIGVFDRTNTLVRVKSWSGQNTAETSKWIRILAAEFEVEPEDIHIDVGGIGGGVISDLESYGDGETPGSHWHVDAVDFGGAVLRDFPPTIVADELRLADRKAELYVGTNQLLRARMLCIPERFKEVWDDLTAPKIQPAEKRGGKLAVEDKKSLRKRIRRSTDYGDMAVISQSNSGGAPVLSFGGDADKPESPLERFMRD